jgi:hypothetical protein
MDIQCKIRLIVANVWRSCRDLADMPQKQRNASARLAQMRQRIASLAAQLMARDGIADFGLAKRKAARQLGVAESEALPKDAEVEAELRLYQAIYQGDELKQRLRTLRMAALSAMRLLAHFSPYLTGPVLDGTAGRFAEVELALYPDSGKAVELFLLDQCIEYRPEQPQRGETAAAETVLKFDLDGVPFSAAVFSPIAERTHPRSSRSGRSSERASLAVVESLVKADS